MRRGKEPLNLEQVEVRGQCGRVEGATVGGICRVDNVWDRIRDGVVDFEVGKSTCPCSSINCSIPNKHTRLRAERGRNMITKMELRSGTEDKEAREGSIAGVNKSREKVGGLVVDGERMCLKY